MEAKTKTRKTPRDKPRKDRSSKSSPPETAKRPPDEVATNEKERQANRARALTAAAARLKRQINKARKHPADFIEFCLRTPQGGRIKLEWFHREWLNYYMKGERVQIEASRNHAKCLGDFERIHLADGTRITAKDAAKLDAIRVVTYNETEQKYGYENAVVVDNGKKPLVEVRLQARLEIARTENEPVLTPNGFVDINTLKPGDYIAAARTLPEAESCNTLPDAEARFIGYILGNGGCGRNRFSSLDKSIVQDANVCADTLDMYLRKVDCPDHPCDYDMVGYKHGTPTHWLRKHSLKDKKASDKRIPDAVFQASNDVIRACITAYWDCDGTINPKSRQIAFGSKSKGLIDDTQTLLLRFGLVGKISKKNVVYKGAPYPFYTLQLGGASARTFYSEWLLKKSKRSQLTQFPIESRCDRSLENCVPIQWLRDEAQNGCVVLRKLVSSQLHPRSVGLSVTKPRARKFCTWLRKKGRLDIADKLEALCTDQIWWTRVESVRKTEPQQTWAIQVENNPVYVCENIISHNTTILLGYICWRIGCNPNIRIKLFAQSERRAKERLFEISEILMKNELTKLVFPEMTKSKDGVWSKVAITVSREAHFKDPTLEAAGITSSIEGGRADILAFDDVVDERNSILYPQVREQIKVKVYNELMPMLEPGGQAISIATPHHNCLLDETFVMTQDGRVRAKDLTEGHKLLVDSSTYTEPLKITRREVRNAPARSVSLWCHPEPLTMTNNHRVPTQRGLVKLGDLAKDDLLYAEIAPHQEATAEQLKELLPKNFEARVDPPTGFPKNPRLSKAQLSADLTEGLTYGEIAKKHGYSSKSYVLLLVKRYGLPRRRSAKLMLDAAPMHDDFWRLVGYWLAEGSICKRRDQNMIRLTFGRKDDPEEQALADDAQDIVQRVLGIRCHKFYEKTSTGNYSTQLVFHCKALRWWLLENFGSDSKTKRLPNWFNVLPARWMRQCLRGHFLGDGDVHSACSRISSSSLDLLSDWQRVLASHNIPVRISKTRDANSVVICGSQVNCATAYVLALLPEQAEKLGIPNSGRVLTSSQPQKVKLRDGKLWFPIRKIRDFLYTGTVHDIATTSGYFHSASAYVKNSDLIASFRTNPQWESYIYACGNETDPYAPLWPGRIDREMLKKLRQEMGPVAYDRAFRCVAISKETVPVRPEWIQYYDNDVLGDPWRLICVQSYDLAIAQTRKSDYFACVTLLYDPERNFIFVADAWHGKLSFGEQGRRVEQEARRWQPQKICVEETGYQSALRQFLMENVKTPLPVYPVKPRGNKSQRLISVTPLLENGRVWFNPKLDPQTGLEVVARGDLIGELLSFPLGQNDDLCDAFVYGVMGLQDFQEQKDDSDDWVTGSGVSTKLSIIGM